MEISGYGSLFSAQEMEEISRVSREKSREQKSVFPGLAGGDTVSISEEARRLAEQMRLEKENERLRQEQEAQKAASTAKNTMFAGSGENTAAPLDEEEQAESPAGSAQGAGGSSGSSSADQAESIREKIKQLEAKLQSTASASLPENVKQSQINVLQSQINELQQQLNALEQQSA